MMGMSTALESPPTLGHEFVRALLTLKEVTMLAAVKESTVRKDIENKVIRPIKCGSNRLLFRWPDVYVMAAVYKYDWFNPAARKMIADEIETSKVAVEYRRDRYLRKFNPCSYPFLDFHPQESVRDGRVEVEKFFAISMSAVKSECAPAVGRYVYGLNKVVEQEGILGGEAVFRGTRLPVRHIGMLRAKGESVEDIRLDYPSLGHQDIEFSEMYFRANPIIGRPRESGGGTDGGDFAR